MHWSEGPSRQFIAIPSSVPSGFKVYCRENVERGRWSPAPDNLKDALFSDGWLERDPVSFVITERVARDIVTKDWAYSLPGTAYRAHERAGQVGEDDEWILDKFFDAIIARDTAFLNDHLKSEKLVTKVKVVPVEELVRTATSQDAQVPTPVVVPTVIQEVSKPAVDDTLKATFYPPSYADNYVSREIHGVKDFDVFDVALARHQNVLLGGDTGAGKTFAIKAWAALRGLRVAQVTGNPQNDAYRVIGKPTISNGTSVFQPGLLTELFRHGGVLLLDEVDLNTDGFQSELFPTLRERVLTIHDDSGETLFAHPNFIVFATMNGSRGYRRRELDAAMKNRFTHIIDWRYDPSVEKRLGIVEAVLELASGIRSRFYLEEITTPLPTNALIDFQSLARDINLKYAIGNFVARFAKDEQESISITINGMYSNIKSDLNIS